MRLAAGTTLHANVLLFDMDGTLVNSAAVIAGLWRHWAARHCLDSEAVLLASPGRRTIETVRMFAPLGTDAPAEAARLAAVAAETTEAAQLLWDDLHGNTGRLGNLEGRRRHAVMRAPGRLGCVSSHSARVPRRIW